MTDIEALAEEIQQRHARRLDGPDSIPMVPRSFKPRPRPQTAIISEAAQRKMELRYRARESATEHDSYAPIIRIFMQK